MKRMTLLDALMESDVMEPQETMSWNSRHSPLHFERPTYRYPASMYPRTYYPQDGPAQRFDVHDDDDDDDDGDYVHHATQVPWGRTAYIAPRYIPMDSTVRATPYALYSRAPTAQPGSYLCPWEYAVSPDADSRPSMIHSKHSRGDMPASARYTRPKVTEYSPSFYKQSAAMPNNHSNHAKHSFHGNPHAYSPVSWNSAPTESLLPSTPATYQLRGPPSGNRVYPDSRPRSPLSGNEPSGLCSANSATSRSKRRVPVVEKGHNQQHAQAGKPVAKKASNTVAYKEVSSAATARSAQQTWTGTYQVGLQQKENGMPQTNHEIQHVPVTQSNTVTHASRLSEFDAAVIVQTNWRRYRLAREHAVFRQLCKASSQLQLASAKAEEYKVKNSNNILLEKQMLEVSELLMRVVLSLDSVSCRAPEHRVVKKRLTTMALRKLDQVQQMQRQASIERLASLEAPAEALVYTNTGKVVDNQAPLMTNVSTAVEVPLHEGTIEKEQDASQPFMGRQSSIERVMSMVPGSVQKLDLATDVPGEQEGPLREAAIEKCRGAYQPVMDWQSSVDSDLSVVQGSTQELDLQGGLSERDTWVQVCSQADSPSASATETSPADISTCESEHAASTLLADSNVVEDGSTIVVGSADVGCMHKAAGEGAAPAVDVALMPENAAAALAAANHKTNSAGPLAES